MGAKAQHDPRYRQFCKRLREWRIAAGFTQRALAERLKKPHSFVAKSEWGDRRLDPLELGRWVNACNVPASEVLEVIGVRQN